MLSIKKRILHSGFYAARRFFCIMSLDKIYKLLALKFLHTLLNNTSDCPEQIIFNDYFSNITKNFMSLSPSYTLSVYTLLLIQ